jgi:hypothetical protein
MLICFTIQHQLQNTREKKRCVKNYSASTIFYGVHPTCTLVPQPIHQKAKHNVFKLLNARNLLFKQCKKINILQLHVSPVAFPISHWLLSLFIYPWFLASATMLMRSTLFWDITWHHVVIVYQCFGTMYRLVGLLTLEDGTDTLSQNIGKQLPHDPT